MATRLRLASLTGAAVESAWRLPTSLPLPQPDALQPDEVVELAMTQRLDLAAARRSLALHDDALALTRRWRWLGTVHLEYEREREADGVQLSGPGLSLQLPIFNQGQPAVARASSERDRAQAHLDLLLAQTIEESRAGLAAMRARAGMIDRYREALVPGSERIVELTQRRFDFMLVGAFDLLATKQMQYDTYQAYLESVRDYWTARSSLRRVVGGRLPDDGVAAGESSAIDYMLPTEDDSGTPVHRHGSAPGAAHGSMHQGSHGAQSNRSGADTATNTQAGSAQDSGHASHHGEAGHQHGAVSEGVQAHAEDRDDDGRQRAEGRAHHDAHHHGAGHAPDGANASGREPRS